MRRLNHSRPRRRPLRASFFVLPRRFSDTSTLAVEVGSKHCRGSRNSHDASTNGAVSVGMANGVNATFIADLHDDREHRAYRCVRHDPRSSADRTPCRARRRETGLKPRRPPVISSLSAPRRCAVTTATSHLRKRIPRPRSEFTASPASKQQRGHAVALQEYLRNALEDALDEITIWSGFAAAGSNGVTTLAYGSAVPSIPENPKVARSSSQVDEHEWGM